MKRILTFTALVDDGPYNKDTLPDGRDFVRDLEHGWGLRVIDYGFERIDIEEDA